MGEVRVTYAGEGKTIPENVPLRGDCGVGVGYTVCEPPYRAAGVEWLAHAHETQISHALGAAGLTSGAHVRRLATRTRHEHEPLGDQSRRLGQASDLLHGRAAFHQEFGTYRQGIPELSTGKGS